MEFVILDAVNALLLSVSILVLFMLTRPRIRESVLWRANVTPLASIIGSGFLVVAPILSRVLGPHAVWGMVGISAAAFLIGSVIRFNIRHAEPVLLGGRAPRGVLLTERVSSLVLSLAYVISIAFYLRLLASFVLEAVEVEGTLPARSSPCRWSEAGAPPGSQNRRTRFLRRSQPWCPPTTRGTLMRGEDSTTPGRSA